MLLRALAEWLSFLRCVDTCEANLVLLPVVVEQCDGVAIRHTDYPPLEGISRGANAPESNEERSQQPPAHCEDRNLSSGGITKALFTRN